MADELMLDLGRTPFSRAGSYMAISSSTARAPQGASGLFIKDVSGWRGWNWNASHLIELVRNGQALRPEVRATPSKVTLTVDGGRAEIVFEDAETLRLRVDGVGLRLTHYSDSDRPMMRINEHQWRTRQFAFSVLAGSGNADGTCEVPFAKVNAALPRAVRYEVFPEEGKAGEAALEMVHYVWRNGREHKAFDECEAEVRREFEEWLNDMPEASEELRRARTLAAYVNWSSIVGPRGLIRRPAMLMSKDVMRNVWSWDHCFNAIALAGGRAKLAWDQFMLMFDHQHESGQLPDSLNDDHLDWKCVKPPVHGWALGQMVAAGLELTEERAAEAYPALAKWTRYWLEHRDSNGNGLPEYEHGNDSGWDNATVFDAGFPAESADLSAYLVLQMEQTAELAQRLGRAGEAKFWRAESERLLKRMLEHLWDGERFRVLRSGDGAEGEGASLMRHLPIVLGERLPREVREKLIGDLRRPGLFMTEYGLATESPESGLYLPDGYWRGPIWAPPMLVIADGLSQCGENELARELARRFCNVCGREGFYENFDALTGQGLRDPSYTWTRSVFLTLASRYLMRA